MKNQRLASVILLLFFALLFASSAIVAQAACGPFEACIKITYPDGEGPPAVEPDSLVINEDQRNVGQFAFAVVGENAVETEVVFKCQSSADCRSPIVSNGTERWSIRINQFNAARPVVIPDTLAGCDRECDPREEPDDPITDCMKRHCTYPYMVRDVAGSRPPLDPGVVMEPR